jgi:hypothetical protein
MSSELRIVAFDQEGGVLADDTIEDVTGEGAEFYAHQALHRDFVTCVEVFGRAEHGPISAWATALRRCDPGVDFAQVVDA